jgi:ATPase family protein associated with various cellular activities (AAA)/winged helix domain-containing protein
VPNSPVMPSPPPQSDAPELDDRSPRQLGASVRAYALAALGLHSGLRSAPAVDAPELRFLRLHADLLAAKPGAWAAALRVYLKEPNATDVALVRLTAELRLTLVEVLAVALAAAVEDDVMVGRALALFQAPLGGSRPTVALIASAFAEVLEDRRRAVEALLTGTAVQSGLLALLGDGPPLPERPVAVPLHLCLALNGSDGSFPGTAIGLGRVLEIPLAPSTHAEAERHAAGLHGPDGEVLVLRTGSVAEGRSVAAAVARAAGRRPLFIETDKTAGLAPWLTLRDLLPVFCLDIAPGEHKVVPVIPLYRGPSLVVCGPDGAVDPAGGTLLSWPLTVPPREERAALWHAALGQRGLGQELAREHRHGSGRIAHLGRIVRHRLALARRSEPTRADVLAASWNAEGGGLDALAQPLADPVPDAALVMTPALRLELDALMLRCRVRDGLVEGLGASATCRYHPGVRALFIGPSGTGKTLAAGWLATSLGLPVYRVDLASVTSKYIGETEKNLAQLLARAEQAEVILLFDEADSLFAKRTDVREANDRFANAQTNYLLQRIEFYEGIVILTSNSRARFDESFARRLDAIVEFPLPGPDERRELWVAHLGTGHRLTPRDMNRLAARVDFAGGEIRNVVLAAAVQARAEGRVIVYADILRGLAREYKKVGRQMPVDLGSSECMGAAPATR